MKICPFCNQKYPDSINNCKVDGAILMTRENLVEEAMEYANDYDFNQAMEYLKSAQILDDSEFIQQKMKDLQKLMLEEEEFHKLQQLMEEMTTYELRKKWEKALNLAEEILEMEPNNITALKKRETYIKKLEALSGGEDVEARRKKEREKRKAEILNRQKEREKQEHKKREKEEKNRLEEEKRRTEEEEKQRIENERSAGIKRKIEERKRATEERKHIAEEKKHQLEEEKRLEKEKLEKEKLEEQREKEKLLELKEQEEKEKITKELEEMNIIKEQEEFLAKAQQQTIPAAQRRLNVPLIDQEKFKETMKPILFWCGIAIIVVISLKFILGNRPGQETGSTIVGKSSIIITDDNSNMILMSGGKFLMGTKAGPDNETPPHKVKIDAFYIDQYEITNEQFLTFLNKYGDSRIKEDEYISKQMIYFKDAHPHLHIISSEKGYKIEEGYEDHPVIGVTWYGAYEYAKFYGKRLPTEAEWEFAAMGGLEDDTPYPWGDELSTSNANYRDSEIKDTKPIGSYIPNAYDLYDMSGNATEWCYDWYDSAYYVKCKNEGTVENPKGVGASTSKVLRGGSWNSLPQELRVTARKPNAPGYGLGNYGFRCAMDIPE